MAFSKSRLTRCCHSLCRRLVTWYGLLSSAHLKRCSPPNVTVHPVPMDYHSVYRSAGSISAKYLFAGCEALLQGTAPQAGFGAPRTVFIPKSGDTNARGLLIRTLEGLRPLTLCNCDRKVITSALCAGLRKYSTQCIHPSQRCVAQRMMTDNIFEIDTASIALRTCCSEDPGILLTDFSCACTSVDHR